MRVKKIFSILSILVVFLSMVLQSCYEPKKADYNGKIQGKWIVSSYRLDKDSLILHANFPIEEEYYMERYEPNGIIQIGANYITTYGNNTPVATYSLEDNKIIIALVGSRNLNFGILITNIIRSYKVKELYDVWDIKNLDDNTLIIEAQPSSGKGLPIIIRLIRI